VELPPDPACLFKEAMSRYNAVGKLVDSGQASWDQLTEGLQREMDEVIGMLRVAAMQGHADAQQSLGDIYVQGEVVKQDLIEAVRLFRQAAQQGQLIAQYHLGLMYCEGEGVKQDYVEALRWYREAAEQGDAAAQNDLGTMHEHGQKA